MLTEISIHISEAFGLLPVGFQYVHFYIGTDLFVRTIEVYSHVIFAVYIMVTFLEAFKGQTLGKYVFSIRVVKVNGEKIGLLESGIRNSDKIFLLPLDLIIGLLLLRKKGYLRFFDYYTGVKTEKIIK